MLRGNGRGLEDFIRHPDPQWTKVLLFLWQTDIKILHKSAAAPSWEVVTYAHMSACACVYKLEGEQKPTDNKLIFTDGFSLRIASILCYYWGLRFARWWITVRHNNLDIRCVIHQICCFTAAFVSVTIVGFPFELFTLTDVNVEAWSANSILSRTRPRITAPWCKGLNIGVGSRAEWNGFSIPSPVKMWWDGSMLLPPPIQGQTLYLLPL